MAKNGFSSEEILQGIKAEYLRKKNESLANCYKWLIQATLFIYKCVAFSVAIGMGLSTYFYRNTKSLMFSMYIKDQRAWERTWQNGK